MSAAADRALEYAARGWAVLPLYEPADGERGGCSSSGDDDVSVLLNEA